MVFLFSTYRQRHNVCPKKIKERSMMKQVCFVLHADLFTPWPIMRAMKEIQVLKDAGYAISVFSWIKDKTTLPGFEERDGIQVYRFKLAPPKNSLIKRSIAYRNITNRVAYKIKELKPVAIVCHDLEMLAAAVKAKKALDVPLFYDAHEDWPGMVKENSALEAKIFAFMEKQHLRHVTHSYTYGNDLTDKFKKMGHPATTLYNSKYIDSVPKIEPREIAHLKKALGIAENDFVLGFAGSVNLQNGIEQTVTCLKDLPEDIKYLVVGGSGRKDDLEKARDFAQKQGVGKRVIFTGRVDSGSLLKHIACFDLGTALFQPTHHAMVVRVPNKLFDYMALSVPMVVAEFPNMKKIVALDSDCGIAVDPMDTGQITEAIRHFYENRDDIEKMGARGRRSFETTYCWDVQRKKLLETHPLWRGEF
jgi:glycosyltransferase involved in cell wall biosynthesis